MIFGIPPRRLFAYAAVIAALFGALFWQRSRVDTSDVGQPGIAATPAFATLPDLVATAESVGFSAAPTRDLFAVRPVATPAAPPPAPAPTPVRPDPAEVAREAVRKTLDSILVLGILGSDSGPLAVLEVNGQVFSVTQGQEVLPGYRVKSVSLDYLELIHTETGLEKLFALNASGN